MNIVLIGYRCSGKTSIGRRLADQLGMDFVDSDDGVEEKAGIGIGHIVAQRGWRHFREIEKGVIASLSFLDNTVIATGGGVVMEEENIRNLKANGYLVWLDAAPAILKRRMSRDPGSFENRPSLTGAGSVNELEAVLKARIPLYRSASDLVIDSGRLGIREAAAEIAVNLPSWPAETGPVPAGAVGRQGG